MLLKTNKKGFILLEVLLSLVILSAGIVGIIKTYSISLRAQKHAQHQTSATILASKLKDQIELRTLEDLNGQEYIGYKLFKWIVKKEPFYDNEDLSIVRIEVVWNEKFKEYKVCLIKLYPESFIDDLFKEYGVYPY